MAAETISTEELDAALRAVDPRARVVSSRIMHRIIKQEQKLGLLGVHIAHRRSLTLGLGYRL